MILGKTPPIHFNILSKSQTSSFQLEKEEIYTCIRHPGGKIVGFPVSCVFWDACQWTQWSAEISVEQWMQPGYILIMPSETITGSVAPFRAAMSFSTDLGFSDIMWNASSIKWKWSVMVECFSRTETLEKQTESFPDTETIFCRVNDHLTKKNNHWFSCAPHITKKQLT